MVKVLLALVVCGAAGIWLWFGTGIAPSSPLPVALLPLGDVPTDRLHLLEREIEAFYDADVTLLDRRPLPRSAWYEPRGRYRADSILRFLERTVDQEWEKVIAVTAVDISATNGEHKDWGVLGLGRIDGRACVISSFRTAGKGERMLKERLAKIALHELGHTMGLPHCPSEGSCFMKDARGRVATIDGEAKDLCDRCRARVGRTAQPAP
jgi:archaemetzincin